MSGNKNDLKIWKTKDKYYQFHDDDLFEMVAKVHRGAFVDNNIYDKYEWFSLMSDERASDIWRQFINKKSRRNRVLNRIEYILANYESPSFITLTFSPKALDRTDAKTRLRAVKRFCKRVLKASEGKYSFTDDPAFVRLLRESFRNYDSKKGDKWQYGRYVANIDFGDQFGREHYHILFSCYVDSASRIWWSRYYGNVDMESMEKIPVRRMDGESDDDYHIRVIKNKKICIAKYSIELWFHTLKTTSKAIFSRTPRVKYGV